MKITESLRKIANLKKRIRAVCGGTGAGKTIGILLFLIDFCQTSGEKELVSVVSVSMPHLKRGAMRDFLKIMIEHGYFHSKNWNKTDKIYTFENGSQIEFFSADQVEKVRGGRRDVLFLNEANSVSFEIFDQLEVRTKKFVFLDWNPVSEFWFYSELLPKRNDVDFVTLTYLDNDALPDEVKKAIEQRKNNKFWWTVYGLGKLGEPEWKIFKDWIEIESVPDFAKLERYWLDFGYSNDPTAIGAVYAFNGGFVLDEIAYQKGLTNKQIADIFLNLEKALVIADGSEPKSIDELSSYGLMVLPSEKGRGSVLAGIQFVQGQKISVTRKSINIWKEYRNYFWMTDENGKVLNEPSPIFNHHMDGIRYALWSLRGVEYRKKLNVRDFGGYDPLDLLM